MLPSRAFVNAETAYGELMKSEGQLLPEHEHVSEVRAEGALDTSSRVVSTRDREVIRHWAEKRHAEPATGEATTSGPATVNVNDGGAGIRFNFPGTGLFRPISWDEWFSNFDRHLCAFVYERDSPEGPLSHRYRIVKAADWKDLLE
jgi:hypothetical protein